MLIMWAILDNRLLFDRKLFGLKPGDTMRVPLFLGQSTVEVAETASAQPSSWEQSRAVDPSTEIIAPYLVGKFGACLRLPDFPVLVDVHLDHQFDLVVARGALCLTDTFAPPLPPAVWLVQEVMRQEASAEVISGRREAATSERACGSVTSEKQIRPRAPRDWDSAEPRRVSRIGEADALARNVRHLLKLELVESAPLV
jgi:hypothetical protein